MELRELIPGLPEEVGLECLTRVPYPAHGVCSRVSKRWRHLLLSKEFYSHRKRSGFTRKAVCLVQARYGLSLFDPLSLSWDPLEPLPKKYPADGIPLFCKVASTEGKLVVMGGWAPSTWEPVRDVFVYEFTTRKWTRAADMPSTRSFFAIGAIDGKVFVAGGHDESKNALDTAWVFDVEGNEWSELGRMREERDECEGVVVGTEFWVVSGYGTEMQGEFKSSAEVYDVSSGVLWRVVEEAWPARSCPRSTMLQNGKLFRRKIDDQVLEDDDDEYSAGVGVVQSACWVEI